MNAKQRRLLAFSLLEGAGCDNTDCSFVDQEGSTPFAIVSRALERIQHEKSKQYGEFLGDLKDKDDVLKFAALWSDVRRKSVRVDRMLSDLVAGGTFDQSIVDQLGDQAVYAILAIIFLGETFISSVE